MNRLLTLTLYALIVLTATAQNVIRVKAGDVQSLLDAIEKANTQNADTMSERLFVLIPNGTYDLGERVLTTIIGHNIALVGESMEGTVIMNAPPVEKEGISSTGTLLNRGWDTYVQDLTLKNELDFYHSGPAGRAVCWQDKGHRTIFKRVRMLSYQDTYYSHSEACQHYMEDCEIHGTVDFICGAGDVYFNRCLIVTEKCKEGAEKNVIAAPRTSVTEWGYVFNGCTIRNIVSPFYLARAWHTHPRCVWMNTRLETPEQLLKERYDPYGLRTVDNDFFEFHTTDAQGHDITPQTNVVNFICKEESRQVETIMKADVARKYTLKNIFPDWEPEKIVKKLSQKAEKLRKAY
jgi:pectin methylesterase-like acyl-CoA thioesterase